MQCYPPILGPASVIGRHPGFCRGTNLCGLSPVITDDVGYLHVSWLSAYAKKRYQAFAGFTILVWGSLGDEVWLRIKVCLSACMSRIALHSSGGVVKP